MSVHAAKRAGGMAALALLLPATAALAQGAGQRPAAAQGPMRFSSPASATTLGAGGDPGGSLRDFLFGSRTLERKAMPPAARFRADDGDGFFLQRTGGTALLRFDDNAEVWSLTASAGPRGDTIFKNDVGDPVLRMTRLGGVTLFTDERPDGMAVAMAGGFGGFRTPGPIGPNALFQVLASSSARASRAAQHLISFVVVPDVTPASDWVFADAAIVTAEAFARLAALGAEGRSLAARFARVEFLSGGSVQCAAVSGVVRITVAPNKGVAGRPSSQKVFLLLRRR